MKQVFEFEQLGSNFCCGLEEIGEFRFSPETEQLGGWGSPVKNEDTEFRPNPDMAYFATTLSTQTGSIRKLKEFGFKRVASWTRDNGKRLYIWVFTKRRAPKKKKARKHVRAR